MRVTITATKQHMDICIRIYTCIYEHIYIYIYIYTHIHTYNQHNNKKI